MGLRAHLAVLTLAGMAVTTPPSAAAQAGGPPATLLQPYVGQLIRIRSTSVRTTGRLVALGRDSVILAVDDREHAFPLAGIDALWVQKQATVTGLLVEAQELGQARRDLGAAEQAAQVVALYKFAVMSVVIEGRSAKAAIATAWRFAKRGIHGGDPEPR